jgi:uncharacterized membrane protein YcaP (DUF421 family)
MDVPMSVRRSLVYAFGVVAVVTIATAIINRSVAHTPYIIEFWTVMALLVVAGYWLARSIKKRIARSQAK